MAGRARTLGSTVGKSDFVISAWMNYLSLQKGDVSRKVSQDADTITIQQPLQSKRFRGPELLLSDLGAGTGDPAQGLMQATQVPHC